MSSIESYLQPGRTYGSGGWGEQDDGAEFRRAHRRVVRDLAPDEEVPLHPDAARGFRYIVEGAPVYGTIAGVRRVDYRPDVDAAARAATEQMSGGDAVLWYLLAQQWAMHEHGGPLLRRSGYLDRSPPTDDHDTFVPGQIVGDRFVYDCASDGCRYEARVDDETRREAQEWVGGTVVQPSRRLVEVGGAA